MENKILQKIKDGEVKMTSRRFFFLKWATLFITSVFFLILSIYIFAYITFLFVDNGLIYIPVLTYVGLADFIVEVPWTLVLLGLASLFFFSITSKTFYRLYRRPFITFFFSILIIIMITHIIFVESGAMRRVKQEAYSLNMQLVPDKFLEFRNSQTGTLYVGRVIATTTNSIVIVTRTREMIELFVQEPIDTKDFLVDMLIDAYAERVNEKLYAKSIEIVE